MIYFEGDAAAAGDDSQADPAVGGGDDSATAPETEEAA